MINFNTPEARFAIHAVRQASLLVKLVQSKMVSPALTKGDRSPVTVADFASQALISKLLAESFPDDPLVGEEDARCLQTAGENQTLDQVTGFVGNFTTQATPERVCAWIERGGAEPAQRFWTLDPIDGTKGFLRGDQYVVALALIIDGQVQVGVLGCPDLRDGYLVDRSGPGSLVIAVRGSGTWVTALEGEEKYIGLHVSSQADVVQARILRSFESGHTNISQVDLFVQALGVQAAPVRMDSQAKYAVQAAGAGELYLRLLSSSQPNYREKIWDQAAGSLLIEEAGGRVTDLDGKPLDFTAGRELVHNRGILASNGPLHAGALQALRAIQA